MLLKSTITLLLTLSVTSAAITTIPKVSSPECDQYHDEMSCDGKSNHDCTWCVAGADAADWCSDDEAAAGLCPKEWCYSWADVKKLPPGVYGCDKGAATDL